MFSGERQRSTLIITFAGSLKLIMRLNGANAEVLRSSMCDTLRRHFAGDLSLLAEIEANSVSNAPLAQLARDSLCSDPVQTAVVEEDPHTKKRRLERAEEMADLDIVASRQRLDMADCDLLERKQIMDIQAKKMDMEAKTFALDFADRARKSAVQAQMVSFESMKTFTATGKAVDPAFVKVLTSNLLKVACTSLDPLVEQTYPVIPTAAIQPIIIQPAAAVVQTGVQAPLYLTVGKVARDNGYYPTLQKVMELGNMTARLYVEKYGTSPLRMSGFNQDNGKYGFNAYTLADRQFMVEVLHRFLALQS
jgi:hypothetical protein